MSFNLDITTYSNKELEDILGLVAPFSILDINRKGLQLKENINNDQTIAPDLKKRTIDFITNCVTKLSETQVPLDTEPQRPFLQNKFAPVDTEVSGHEIIKAKSQAYGLSLTQEHYPGTLNPLEKRFIRKFLNIDTRFRDNYLSTTATNCSFNLPISFNSVLSMQVTAIEIPNSFYVISRQYNNNHFSIRAGNEKIIYIIPDGNYTNEDFVDFLNNYATNNGYTASTNPLLYYMAFSINILGAPSTGGSGSGQFIIGINSSYPASSTPFEFSVNFDEDINGNPDTGTPFNMKLGWMMGFRAGEYVGSSAYVSEGVVDFFGSRYCYLAINDYTSNINNGFYGAFNNSMLNNNILARMSIGNLTKTAYNIYNWNNMNSLSYSRQYFGPINIAKIGIQLLDEFGRPMNLNNMDFSFCLLFEVQYNM
jgi:hypothetical protein